MLRKFKKKLLEHMLRPWVKWYTSKERRYKYKNIIVQVYPGVFHPALFFSTKYLLKYIESISLNGKNILELGAGTGLMALYAASKGGIVTASDINPDSVLNIRENIRLNEDLIQKSNGKVSVFLSDMFSNIPDEKFDLILLNPPYYRGEIKKNADYAWYAGPDYNYYKSLFGGMSTHIHRSSEILMVLSQDVEMNEIKKIATSFHFDFHCLHQKKTVFEKNYIYKIASIAESAK